VSRWLALIPLLVLGALGLLFAVYALGRDPAVKPDAMVGKPIPAVALAPLAGGAPQPVSADRGPHLINLFASWCAPCAIEHPQLMRLKESGVRIIGVAYKDEPEDSRAFLRRLGDPFTMILADPDGRAGVEFGVSGVPETFAVVDGVIVAKHSGPLTPEAADRLASRLRAR
jgi:cytochrome c biogenesis protein CcmG, thiol:disulfide interchange protein DsbE